MFGFFKGKEEEAKETKEVLFIPKTNIWEFVKLYDEAIAYKHTQRYKYVLWSFINEKLEKEISDIKSKHSGYKTMASEINVEDICKPYITYIFKK